MKPTAQFVSVTLQLLSPKEADRRLRESGGEDVVQMHCCDGTLEGGAVVRLHARPVLVRAAMNFSTAAAVGEGADDDERTEMASNSSGRNMDCMCKRFAVCSMVI